MYTKTRKIWSRGGGANPKPIFKNFLQDVSPFCGATDTPVLDLCWRLLWVSKPEWKLSREEGCESKICVCRSATGLMFQIRQTIANPNVDRGHVGGRGGWKLHHFTNFRTLALLRMHCNYATTFMVHSRWPTPRRRPISEPTGNLCWYLSLCSIQVTLIGLGVGQCEHTIKEKNK